MQDICNFKGMRQNDAHVNKCIDCLKKRYDLKILVWVSKNETNTYGSNNPL